MRDEIRIEIWDANSPFDSMKSNVKGRLSGRSMLNKASQIDGNNSANVATTSTTTADDTTECKNHVNINEESPTERLAKSNIGITVDPTVPPMPDSSIAVTENSNDKVNKEPTSQVQNTDSSNTPPQPPVNESSIEDADIKKKKSNEKLPSRYNNPSNGGFLSCCSFKRHELIKFLHSGVGVPRTSVNYTRENDGTFGKKPYSDIEIERGTLNEGKTHYGNDSSDYSQLYPLVPDPALSEEERQEMGMITQGSVEITLRRVPYDVQKETSINTSSLTETLPKAFYSVTSLDGKKPTTISDSDLKELREKVTNGMCSMRCASLKPP